MPVLSAIARKSITELSKRRSRTLFVIATLALAVGSMGLFALPTLMNRAMLTAARSDRLPDLSVSTRPLVLAPTQLEALATLPNVSAVQPQSSFDGRVYVGGRRASVTVRGVADFGRQRVDVVHVVSGSAPRYGEVLTDVQNANQGQLRVAAGERLRVIGADGATRRLRVSGVGRNLDGGQLVSADDEIVLYSTPGTVASLSGVRGDDNLAFRVQDTRPAAVRETVRSVGRSLAAVPGFKGFSELPTVRAAGDWPGRAAFRQFTKFFYVITVLALLSALVLISNTITTLVAEETTEIAMMQVLGARRRQIAAIYLRTALLLAALGTLAGLLLGIVLADALTRAFGSTFAVSTGFGVDLRIIIVSALVGVAAPPLGALPAIRRAVRLPLREALRATGSTAGGRRAEERLLRRIDILPRTAQIGLRALARRRHRSVSTAVAIAFAVGTLLAVLGLANGVADASRASWGDHGEDVRISSEGRRPLDARAVRLIRATPGVARIEPTFVTDVELAGKDAIVWAVRQATVFHYRLAAGRWYTPTEERTRARVAIVERDIARTTGTRLGDAIRVKTASGAVELRVIGIAANQQESGTALFVPLTTMHAILPGVAADDNDYWVVARSHEHSFVDATTTRIEDTLSTHGYDVSGGIRYVNLRDEIAKSKALTTTIAVLGFLIVGISMAGLASTLTVTVLERRGEIGILRSIGARARDIRQIFATETLTLALAGWLIGVPVGYLLERFLVWLVKQVANVDVPFAFPLSHLAVALVGTVLFAQLITLVPIRRAVKYKPGEALRYA